MTTKRVDRPGVRGGHHLWAETCARTANPRIALPPRIWLALFICAGVALRLYGLASKGFWLDEAASVARADTDWATFFRVFGHGEPNMVLYFGLLHGWLAFGKSEFTIRLLSVLFSVAAIALIYALARRLFDTRVALMSALLLTVNQVHIEFAQDARSYALVVFLATASWLFFVRALDEDRPRDWIGWVATTVLATYAHLFGALVFAAELATLLLIERAAIPMRKVAMAAAAIAFVLIPVGTLAMFNDRSQLNWLHFRLQAVPGVLFAFAGAGSVRGLSVTPALRALVIALAVFAIFDFVRRRPHPPAIARSNAIVLAGAFVPMVVALAVSIFTPVFHGRFLQISQPSFLILVAVGLARIPGVRWMRAAFAVLIALALARDWNYYQANNREDWRGATEYLVRSTRPGDALIIYHQQGWSPVHYYSGRFADLGDLPPIVFPSWSTPLEQQLSVVEMSGPDGPDLRALAALSNRYRRLWAVISHDTQWRSGRPETRDTILRELAHDYRLLDERKFRNVRVLLYQRVREPVGGWASRESK
ncbi:MAG: glycosyltransferase family 39 protein [Candidatus Binataceae bacterium]